MHVNCILCMVMLCKLLVYALIYRDIEFQSRDLEFKVEISSLKVEISSLKVEISSSRTTTEWP